MQLNLSDHDVEVLRGILQDCLPDLRREVARTEDRGFRHQLVEREDLIERLVQELGSTVPQR